MSRYDFLDKYEALRNTIGLMIREDKPGLLGEYAWLPASGSDITYITECGDWLEVQGSTWTNQTGGSNESWEFMLLKADLEVFEIQRLLEPVRS